MPDDKISELPLVPSGTPSKATDEAVVNFRNPDGSFTTMRDTFAKMKAFFSGDKENTGVAQTLVNSHVAETDPHPQYVTQSETDTKFLATIKTGGAYYEQNLVLTQNNTDIVKVPQMGKVIVIDSGAGDIQVTIDATWLTNNGLLDQSIFSVFNNKSTHVVYLDCGADTYFNKALNTSDTFVVIQPKQSALLYREETTGNVFSFTVFLNKETSTGGGGIPEPTANGNWLRTNLGTWVEGVPLSTYNANVNTLKHEVKYGEAITKGQAVYASSADGTNIVVSLASNATEATSSKTLGLAVTTGSLNAMSEVITDGFLDGLNTSTATLGDPVWLGVGGNLIYGLSNKPIAPAHLVYIGVVTRVSATVGEILVKVQNGFELKEIHDVLLGTLVNNDVLVYESSTGFWGNKQLDWLQRKPVDQNMPTTGTITLDFNTETFDNITQTGSIAFAGTNTTGSKKIVKTLVIQGSGNSAHTFTFPVGWINISGVLPDFSKQNYIEITYLDGTVFFCVNKYSAVSTTTPTLVTATILQDFLNVIELKYDRLLDGSITLSTSWFTITGKTVSSVQIVNNTVRITVSVAFATTDTAVVAFTNTAGTADGLQDAVGNKCPDFALQNVVLVRYAYDDFNRSDSTTSVGIASDGTAWQVITGTWGISGNKMYAASAVNSGAATVPLIVKTVGLDCSLKYTITWPSGTAASSVSTIFRYQDANNYMLLQFGRNGTTKMVTADIYKVIGGVLTQIGTAVNVTSQSDGTSNTFIIRVRGYQITMLFNNTVYRSLTDQVLPQGNRVGFRIYDGAGSTGNLDRIDDVVIGE